MGDIFGSSGQSKNFSTAQILQLNQIVGKTSATDAQTLFSGKSFNILAPQQASNLPVHQPQILLNIAQKEES